MTLHAIVDKVAIDQVATIKGWDDFCNWVDQQECTEMAHLIEHGCAVNMRLLAAEIDKAIANSDPVEGVLDIARGIEEIARNHLNAKLLVISDGTGGEDDDVEGYA